MEMGSSYFVEVEIASAIFIVTKIKGEKISIDLQLYLIIYSNISFSPSGKQKVFLLNNRMSAWE